MRRFKQRQGVRDQVMEALVSALTESSNGQPEPKPKRKRLAGKGAVVAGAALYAAGRGALHRRNNGGGPEEEPVDPHRRVRTRV